MLTSPKTYNIIRESGMLKLPSQRTLKDYSNWFKPTLGYQSETFQQLLEDYKVNEFNDAQRYVVFFCL
jgi:predicted metal-dependent hydrolase